MRENISVYYAAFDVNGKRINLTDESTFGSIDGLEYFTCPTGFDPESQDVKKEGSMISILNSEEYEALQNEIILQSELDSALAELEILYTIKSNKAMLVITPLESLKFDFLTAQDIADFGNSYALDVIYSNRDFTWTPFDNITRTFTPVEATHIAEGLKQFKQ